MRIWPILTLLFVASPAFGQSELASLRQHQFVYVPTTRVIEPGIYVMGSSATAGPFGEFAPFPVPTRLDGTSYTEPPWMMTSYVRRSHGSGFNRPQHAPAAPIRPGINRRDP